MEALHLRDGINDLGNILPNGRVLVRVWSTSFLPCEKQDTQAGGQGPSGLPISHS